jgi:hypothetical protein
VSARLLLWLVATGSTLGVASFTGAPAPQGNEEKFTHKGHVDRIWFNPAIVEVWRDCRGCHVFDAQHAVSAPQQQCDACHGKGNLERNFAVGWQDDLGGYRTRTRDAFRHHTHGMLECRECHLPEKTRFLTDFDIVTGPGQCERCHELGAAEAADPAEQGGAKFALFRKWRLFQPSQNEQLAAKLGVPFYPAPKPEQYAQYADKLAKAFAGPTGGVNQPNTLLPVGGDFDHWDHARIACLQCHANIRKASMFEVGTGQIEVDTCGQCHIANAQRAAARAAPATKTAVRELWSLGTFEHADHFRFLADGKRREPAVASESGYAQLADAKDKVCTVCHVQVQNSIGLAERDFPFVAGQSKYRYVDCAGCHAVPGWTTGEDAQKPLHAVSGLHDDPGSWNECARCHTFGGGSFATARPQQQVRRVAGRTFEFNAQTHPDISSGTPASGRAALAECAACHRNKVPELPSRLERRPFRHASHLPAAPDAKSCLECHPLAVTAKNAAELAGDARTYTLGTCAKCHLGSAVKEVEGGAEPAPRAVVAFPHAPHVAKAACTVCHEVAVDGAGVLTVPKAATCEQCHDHKAATDGPTTERLFDDQVRSCAKCHDLVARGKPGLGVPPLPVRDVKSKEWPFAAEQTVFAGFQDNQFHPLEGKCSQCHVAVPIKPGTEANMIGIKRERKDHVAAAHKSRHAGQTGKDPAECLRCHWKTIDEQSFRDAIRGTKQEADWRKFVKPEATRAEFGNENTGYPGTDKARG